MKRISTWVMGWGGNREAADLCKWWRHFSCTMTITCGTLHSQTRFLFITRKLLDDDALPTCSGVLLKAPGDIILPISLPITYLARYLFVSHSVPRPDWMCWIIMNEVWTLSSLLDLRAGRQQVRLMFSGNVDEGCLLHQLFSPPFTECPLDWS